MVRALLIALVLALPDLPEPAPEAPLPPSMPFDWPCWPAKFKCWYR